MDYEWDEANILKHGIDFVDAIGIFAGRFTEAEDLRCGYGERRLLVTGELSGEILRLVYTVARRAPSHHQRPEDKTE